MRTVNVMSFVTRRRVLRDGTDISVFMTGEKMGPLSGGEPCRLMTYTRASNSSGRDRYVSTRFSSHAAKGHILLIASSGTKFMTIHGPCHYPSAWEGPAQQSETLAASPECARC